MLGCKTPSDSCQIGGGLFPGDARLQPPIKFQF